MSLITADAIFNLQFFHIIFKEQLKANNNQFYIALIHFYYLSMVTDLGFVINYNEI